MSFPEGCLICQVVEHGVAILSRNMSLEAPCSHCTVFTEQPVRPPRSYLGVPMHAQAQLIGVLNVFGETGQSFTIEEIALIETLADQIAVSIENMRLRQQMEAAAVKEERARLGRELHDSVTQEIYSLMLFSDAARRVYHEQKSEQTLGLLDRIFEISHQALKEMRLMVYDLHPMALEQAGLAEALHSRLEAVERRSGIEIEFETRGDLDVLPADMQQELYRMAIEALNNATKHAHAGRIAVQLYVEERTVALNIKDNGQGFDLGMTGERGGLGLHSLQERATRLHGKVLIKTSPGQGTAVIIRAPVELPIHEFTEGYR
jgi:signal transduction histidine kinase